MTDVRAYLESKNLVLKSASPTDVHTACFFCGEDESKRGRLYINVDPNADPPGLLFCHLCGKRGALNTLRKHFGDPIPRDGDDVEVASVSRRSILSAAANYYHECLADHEDAYDYLTEERGLTLETIQKHKIGWANGSLHMHLKEKGFPVTDSIETGLVKKNGHDFFLDRITIPYQILGDVVGIRGKQIGGKYFSVAGDKNRVFNVDSAWDANNVILTEGEFDAMVVEQLGYKACGIPGANQWQEGWKTYFDKCHKIYIVFDNDTAGNTGAEKVAKSIGAKSRIVHMPEVTGDELAADPKAKNDPTEWIVKKHHTREEFAALLSAAKGGQLLTVDDGYVEWAEVKEMDGLKFGVRGLDSRLAPGLLPAQVMVVLAKTGTGKTIFTMNMFKRILLNNPDAKILFVSLEQTRGEWFERARRIHRFYNPTATDLDCLPFYRDRMMIIDKNRLTEEDLVACIHEFEFEVGEKPTLVAIDYLGYWARAYQGEPYERTSKAIMALKAIAKDLRVSILTPHQVSRGSKFGEELEADASRDSGVVEETADFMLGLWAEDNRAGIKEDEKTGRVTLKIMKSRHGGAGTKVSLQFAPLSLAMIPVGEDPILEERAKQEFEMAVRNDNFDTAIYRHATGDTRTSVPPSVVEDWKKEQGFYG